MTQKPAGAREGEPGQAALALIEQALRGLRFGPVDITVQDGVVIQIERTERTRVPRSRSK